MSKLYYGEACYRMRAAGLRPVDGGKNADGYVIECEIKGANYIIRPTGSGLYDEGEIKQAIELHSQADLAKAPGLAKAVIYSVELTVSELCQLRDYFELVSSYADGGRLNPQLERVRRALADAKRV